MPRQGIPEDSRDDNWAATLTGLFADSGYYTGSPIDSAVISHAEEVLGVRLPPSYLDLLSYRNGGTLRRRCLRTEFPTSWAPDHIEISGIRGIGGEWGIDTPSGLGNANMIAEWGYPEIGVVICDMPSGGHDAVMLDYSESGPEGEPTVAYIDEDRRPQRIASSFSEFIFRLTACD